MQLPDFLISKKTTKSGKTVRHLRWYVSLALSMLLALGTWNPTGHHFVHYLMSSNPLEGFRPFYILMMFAFWMMALKAVYQSLKWYGATVVALILVSFLYGLHSHGIIDASNANALGWFATISVGLIIFVGVNASIVWKTMTGVYTTDSTNED